MDKTILSLLVLGAILAMLHVPATMVHLAIITTLLLATVKLLWSVIERFSTSNRDLTLR